MVERSQRICTITTMPKTKFGQFTDLLQLASEPLQPIMERLRALILEVHLDACEVVRLGEKSATYGCGPRKMIEGYAYIMPFRSWVNLGFFRGTSLVDPHGLAGRHWREIETCQDPLRRRHRETSRSETDRGGMRRTQDRVGLIHAETPRAVQTTPRLVTSLERPKQPQHAC